MLLNNVTINWAHLDTLDGGFDKNTPQWNLVVVTRDKAQAEEWKAAGLSPKPDSDDEGMLFKMSVKKLATRKDGSPEKAPMVVGADLLPIADPDTVGNGSKGNVRVRTFDYNFNGKKGTGVRLEAVQITELVEFKGKSSDLDGFSVVGDAADSFAKMPTDAGEY